MDKYHIVSYDLKPVKLAPRNFERNKQRFNLIYPKNEKRKKINLTILRVSPD